MKIIKIFISIGFAIFTMTLSANESSEKSEYFMQSSLLVREPYDVVMNELIVLQPRTGHHFNLQAPQKCGNTDILKKEALEIQCQFSESGKQKIIVYICDNENTFCKPEMYDINVTLPGGYVSSKVKTQKQNALYIPKVERSAPSGFIQNNPSQAQELSQKQNKLLFIDFYAIWCPACNMLDEFVFTNQEFSNKTKDFILTQVDVDSDISWKWKEHFKVGRYPTIIIATPQLEEIGRLVGYHSKSFLIDWMSKQYALKDIPLSVAVKKLQTEPKNLLKNSIANSAQNERQSNKLRVGIWYFERGEYQTALSYFNDLTLEESKKYKILSSYKIAQKNHQKDQIIKNLTHLIQKYPNDIELSERVFDLTEYDDSLALKFLPILEKNLSYWRKNTKIIEQDPSLGFLYQTHGMIYENLKKITLSKERYLDCANYFNEFAKASMSSTVRGTSMEQGFCLLKGGKPAEAKALLLTFAQKYKDEFTFNYAYAEILKDLKECNEAHKYVSLAYTAAYGDNLLKAAALKAKIEILLNKKQLARDTIQNTLNSVYLPKSTQISSHRYIAELRKILREEL